MPIRTPAHKQNLSFQEGVQTGRIQLALEVLDLIGDFNQMEDTKSFIYTLTDIYDLAKAQIPA